MNGQKTTPLMRVLHVSPEMTPFSKVGGLADVAGSLPAALRRRGVDCRALTPAWEGVLDSVRDKGYPLTRLSRKVEMVFRWNILRGTVWKSCSEGVPVYFLDVPSLFGTGTIYPRTLTPDTVLPFLFLSLAALDLPEASRWRPDIFHCHDWGTAPLSAALEWHHHYRYQSERYKTVFTIHNLAHQGLLPLANLWEWGLADDAGRIDGMEFFGKGNLLKGALMASDAVTTVSPTYAREIKTRQGGEGLGGVLSDLGSKVTGILNGLDVNYWNPATDSLLPTRYFRENMAGKALCRKELFSRAGWEEDNRPLFVSVGRMAEQKGFSLLLPALEEIAKRNSRIFLLGTGEPEYESGVKEAARRWPGAVHAVIGYDEPLAHLAYAGGDFFLMPSRFEPCGLSQLIALRYGTVPVVRSTGGLADTVRSFRAEGGNGVSFSDYTSEALLSALDEAVRLFTEQKAKFHELQKRGMAQDFSWNASAPLYEKLYTSLLREES